MGVDKLELDDHGKSQVWLMEMGDILERFIDHIPPETRLDYTPESLLWLEEWMLEHYTPPSMICSRNPTRKPWTHWYAIPARCTARI